MKYYTLFLIITFSSFIIFYTSCSEREGNEMTETTASSEESIEILYTISFNTTSDLELSGTGKIVSKEDGVYLILEEDFTSSSGAYTIYISKDVVTDTSSFSKADKKVISSLKKTSGYQEYEIKFDIKEFDGGYLFFYNNNLNVVAGGGELKASQ